MHKFEEVSSNDHQMSVAGGAIGYPMSYVQGRGVYLPCDLSHDECDVTYPPP